MNQVRSRGMLLLALIMVPLLGIGGSALGQEATPIVDGIAIYGPDELVGGASLAEWNARNWQWAVSIPEAANPNFDPIGERCGYGQSGPVFFLPASYSPDLSEAITCVVPEGVALFVVVGGGGCSTVEPPPYFGRDEAELTECAAAVADGVTTMEASINGQAVPDLEQYRHITPMYSLLFPEDNFYGVSAGVALSVSDGYAFIIAPPPPGEYEVTVSVTFEGDDAPFAVTQRIVVQEAMIVDPEASPEATPEATPVA